MGPAGWTADRLGGEASPRCPDSAWPGEGRNGRYPPRRREHRGFGATICLAVEDKVVLAMPLVIVFAELVRTLVRRIGRCRITPAAVASPPHDDRPL
jgi:hypothetical protein